MDFLQREFGIQMIGCTPYGNARRSLDFVFFPPLSRNFFVPYGRVVECVTKRSIVPDIVDGNLKRILGLVNLVYQHFRRADASLPSVPALSASAGSAVVSNLSKKFVDGYRRRVDKQNAASTADGASAGAGAGASSGPSTGSAVSVSARIAAIRSKGGDEVEVKIESTTDAVASASSSSSLTSSAPSVSVLAASSPAAYSKSSTSDNSGANNEASATTTTSSSSSSSNNSAAAAADGEQTPADEETIKVTTTDYGSTVQPAANLTLRSWKVL
jgi:hypothetical protein